ncbi:MAG: pyridoxamine 5'-phosphate oxidase family protein [Acidobacteriota bacterium]|nr:pyridoxamine 5'-phosphate oxidase family protein [Acidobacteriota bacterium]
MGEQYRTLDGFLRRFITKQHVFFVATAPLDRTRHLNLSPKGLNTLRIIDEKRIAYLDHVGSGAETIAHLRENGRIVVMLCAFDGPPKVVRLHGTGEVVESEDDNWKALRQHFPATPGGRAIINIDVHRMSDSCGFGIPEFKFVRERTQLPDWTAKKKENGLRVYQRENNSQSIDGMPALRWVANQSTKE